LLSRGQKRRGYSKKHRRPGGPYVDPLGLNKLKPKFEDAKRRDRRGRET